MVSQKKFLHFVIILDIVLLVDSSFIISRFEK